MKERTGEALGGSREGRGFISYLRLARRDPPGFVERTAGLGGDPVGGLPLGFPALPEECKWAKMKKSAKRLQPGSKIQHALREASR